MREIRERGYEGGYTSVKSFVREIRPPKQAQFERRFETPPGKQAQVDFGEFAVEFTDEPGATQNAADRSGGHPGPCGNTLPA